MGFLQLPSSQIHAALYVATEFSLPDPSLVSTLCYKQPRCQNRSIRTRRGTGQRPKFRALALETGSGQSGTQNAVVFTQMPSVLWTSLGMAGSAAGSDRQASWRMRSLYATPSPTWVLTTPRGTGWLHSTAGQPETENPSTSHTQSSPPRWTL